MIYSMKYLVGLLIPWILKIAIDSIKELKDPVTLLRLGFFLVLTAFIQGIFRFYMRKLLIGTSRKVEYDIRKDILSHVQKMPMSFFDKNPVGRILTRITTDVQTLNEMLSRGVVTLLGDIFMIAGIMIVMITLNLELSLVTFSVLFLLALAAFIFRAKVREPFRVKGDIL